MRRIVLMAVGIVALTSLSVFVYSQGLWTLGGCPKDMVQAGNGYCIDRDRATASGGQKITFGEASASCGDNDKRLCTMQEYHYACVHADYLGIVNMPIAEEDREFIDDTQGHHTFTAVNACENASGVWNDHPNGIYKLANFRCCKDVSQGKLSPSDQAK